MKFRLGRIGVVFLFDQKLRSKKQALEQIRRVSTAIPNFPEIRGNTKKTLFNLHPVNEKTNDISIKKRTPQGWLQAIGDRPD
jgi:hypothetical protein